MRKKLIFFTVISFVLSTLLAGCGLISTEKDDNTKKGAATNTDPNEEDKSDSDEPVAAQSAQSTGKQPWYKWEDFYYSNRVPRHQTGGVWYHTKEEHAGTIDGDFNWDKVDVLEIQLSEKSYYGYKIVPVSFELLENNAAKITVQLKPGFNANKNDAEPARVFIQLNQGTIDKKTKYTILTEDGEQLSTN